MSLNKDSKINRKTRKIEREPVILFTLEGNNKTEKNYINSFKKFGLNIQITRNNETDAVNMAEHHIKECKEIGIGQQAGDAAFMLCDMDLDVSKEKKIEEARLLLEKCSSELIVSNPCFEIWFLQFFMKPSSKQYNNCDEVIKDLRKHIPNYTKSMPISEKIKFDDLNIAISNAKTLRRMSESAGRKEWTKDFSPNTDVYRVIEKLNELSGLKILR